MTPNFFDYKDLKTAYYTLGSGKPLIILHGWGSSSQVMLPIANQLKEIRTCYLIDFPGFGQSPEPHQAWDVDEYTSLVEAFIREVSGDEKTDLLVHSFGGRVALKLLALRSIAGQIDKVLITGGAGLKPKRKFSYYLKKYFAKILKLPFLILPEPIREKGLNKLRETAIWKSLGSSDYQKLSGVMRETFVKSVTETLDGLLPKIEHEVLLIWGSEDTSTPVEQGKRMENGIPHSAFIQIDGAGHYAFLEKPGEFTAIAKAYFNPKG